ncbi:tubulointerstitial nephritis antigen-like [Fopius arisanus]|uniref:Tinagl1_1 protein n=1 Tax=Fopius arisanus TaxID=64838 RepID=A0A0C9RHU1_9HYME|nr:PREDICTED: tubulointerstitial nephritis antigen-like [Fopius arisanus]
MRNIQLTISRGTCSTVRASLLVLLSLAIAHAIPDYSGLPPGPYCAGRFDTGRCCPGRQDDCGAPILSTTCYCDDFCNRTREEDCCPDYWSHCKLITLPTEDPLFGGNIRQCFHEGKYYKHGETFLSNCNICKCSSLGQFAKIRCDEKRCLMDTDLLRELESQWDMSWTPGNYSKFWGRTLTDGIELRLGTLNPGKSMYRMNPVKRHYNPDALPREFDARLKWPRDISGIKEQGWCGSSWAISTAQVASDRFALMSKGAEAVNLSPQHLISCNNRGQQGCRGGYLDRAWLFMRKFGVVDEDCYSWSGMNDKCRIRKRTDLRGAGCNRSPNPFRTELYKVGPAYRLGNETDIMQEILISGPVQATMKVYQDFFTYQRGIYKHSRVVENYPTGYHSVRIVGWGEELYGNSPPTKYWIAANSWGSDWGENGFFKLQKGRNECEIESYVLGIWPKTVPYN